VTVAAEPVGEWYGAVEHLAAAVRDDVHGIDAVWEQMRLRYGFVLQRPAGYGDVRKFLVEALHVAHGRQLLLAFAHRLMEAGLTRRGFTERLMAMLGTSAYTLHSFQSGAFTPVNAVIAAKGFLRACELVCRIDVHGDHAGTGVLVRKSLVATAAHVVADLVELRPDGSLVAREDSVKELTLTFGDVEDYLPGSERIQRRPGEVADLHADWLAWGSGPTPNERSRASFDVHDVSGIAVPAGPWDLALIRLAEPRTMPQRALREQSPPRPPFAIHVLHHPGRQTGVSEPLLWSIGRVDKGLGSPAVRLLHDANTVTGSSGAPVFDRDWHVVALHQAGARDLQRHTDAGSLPASARNRAVPIQQWCGRLAELEGALDDVPFLQELPGPQPERVIGRRGTQARIWAGMKPDAEAEQRLLIVRGEPGTGLRFTKRLVRGLVGRYSDGVVVPVDVANTEGDDAPAFVRRITDALSLESDIPDLLGLTTVHRDERATVAPTLASEIGRLSPRHVWLVVEGFDTGYVSPGVSNVLSTVVSGLAQLPTLRLVLAGWLVQPPRGFESTVEELGPPTAEDIVLSLLPRGEQPTTAMLDAAATLMAAESREGREGYHAARRVVSSLGVQLAQLVPPGEAT
jgi:hypothetical protein